LGPEAYFNRHIYIFHNLTEVYARQIHRGAKVLPGPVGDTGPLRVWRAHQLHRMRHTVYPMEVIDWRSAAREDAETNSRRLEEEDRERDLIDSERNSYSCFKKSFLFAYNTSVSFSNRGRTSPNTFTGNAKPALGIVIFLG
jgi:hypothetical protein